MSGAEHLPIWAQVAVAILTGVLTAGGIEIVRLVIRGRSERSERALQADAAAAGELLALMPTIQPLMQELDLALDLEWDPRPAAEELEQAVSRARVLAARIRSGAGREQVWSLLRVLGRWDIVRGRNIYEVVFDEASRVLGELSREERVAPVSLPFQQLLDAFEEALRQEQKERDARAYWKFKRPPRPGTPSSPPDDRD